METYRLKLLLLPYCSQCAARMAACGGLEGNTGHNNNDGAEMSTKMKALDRNTILTEPKDKNSHL